MAEYTFTVGQRVRRRAVAIKPGGVPAGHEGSVIATLEDGRPLVRWDNGIQSDYRTPGLIEPVDLAPAIPEPRVGMIVELSEEWAERLSIPRGPMRGVVEIMFGVDIRWRRDDGPWYIATHDFPWTEGIRTGGIRVISDAAEAKPTPPATPPPDPAAIIRSVDVPLAENVLAAVLKEAGKDEGALDCVARLARTASDLPKQRECNDRLERFAGDLAKEKADLRQKLDIAVRERDALELRLRRTRKA